MTDRIKVSTSPEGFEVYVSPNGTFHVDVVPGVSVRSSSYDDVVAKAKRARRKTKITFAVEVTDPKTLAPGVIYGKHGGNDNYLVKYGEAPAKQVTYWLGWETPIRRLSKENLAAWQDAEMRRKSAEKTIAQIRDRHILTKAEVDAAYRKAEEEALGANHD